MSRSRMFPVIFAGALLLSVSAEAAGIYQATLNGLQEGTPPGPNVSPATGFITVTVLADSLTVDLNFSGLTGGLASAAHIHCCTLPGTNTGIAIGFPGFPAATSGVYQNTFDLLASSTYTAGFFTASGGTAAAAAAALIAGLDAGTAYSNIHNVSFPGGEIRGNLSAVPESSTALLLMAGMLGVAGLSRRKNRRIYRAVR